MAKKKEEVLHSRGIRARIIDYQRGMKLLSGVRAVRIHSRDYVLLIMEDYMPALGEVDGDLTFLTDKGEEPYKGIRGFYKHQKNEFTLLIESRKAEETERE